MPIKIRSWEYNITEYACPHCGARGRVWEDNCDDYYVGTEYLCIECGGSFRLPEGPSRPMHPDANEIRKQLGLEEK
jgi:DNA-directed RNA polymerase subunit RPC12/RpoP